jgi:hypothetical protein
MIDSERYEEPDSTKNVSAFRVSDLLLCVLAAGLAAGLIKRHAQESAMAYRLNAHPPLSVWTRLVIGHSLSSFGLVFGFSRLIGAIRERKKSVSFGTWVWSIISVYLLMHVLASVTWALTNTAIRPMLTGRKSAASSLSDTIERVSLMTLDQACFDEFAWMLAAVWIVSGILRTEAHSDESGELVAKPAESQDISVAIYTGLAIIGTIFQRILESTGF